jgi:hypothetical protein
MEAAHLHYGNPDAMVVKINQMSDRNKFDQLFPTEYLASKGIYYESLSFQELLDMGEFDESNGKFSV